MRFIDLPWSLYVWDILVLFGIYNWPNEYNLYNLKIPQKVSNMHTVSTLTLINISQNQKSDKVFEFVVLQSARNDHCVTSHCVTPLRVAFNTLVELLWTAPDKLLHTQDNYWERLFLQSHWTLEIYSTGTFSRNTDSPGPVKRAAFGQFIDTLGICDINKGHGIGILMYYCAHGP